MKFSAKKLFQYYLPITLTLFMMVTVKRTVVVEDSAIDRFYGFPLAYISSNFFCTGCYAVIVSNLAIDFAIYFIMVYLIAVLLSQLGLTLKTHWIAITIGSLISLFQIFFFCVITRASEFQFFNDLQYKTVKTEVVTELP